jgi:phosphonate transport system substrate-binding protein
MLGLGLLVGVVLYVTAERPSPRQEQAPANGQAGKSTRVLTFGAIASSPKDEIARMQPMADYIAAHLADQGIGGAQITIAGSVPQMAEMIRAGEVDVYIDSPFPMAKIVELSGAQPILRRWKKGATEYHGVLVVRADSGIERLEDLKGRMVTFEHRVSTSGFLLQKAALIEAGLPLAEFPDPASMVPADRIGYTFTRSDENTVYWVLQGKVAAGATSNLDLEDLAKERRGELQVIHRTMSVPRQLVAQRASLPPSLASGLTRIMLGMEADEEGRRVLGLFDKTTRFDAVPAEWPEKFESILRQANLLEDDLRVH